MEAKEALLSDARQESMRHVGGRAGDWCQAFAEHLCMVCFQPVSSHYDRHDPVFPPLCCHGCGCGEERPADE